MFPFMWSGERPSGWWGNPAAERPPQAAPIIRPGNDPTSGTVSFDGKEISGKMDKSLRKYITDNIAMIFQDPIASLNPRMTVRRSLPRA